MDASRIRVAALALLAAALTTLSLSAGASAQSFKPYSLVVCALGSSETCAPSPTSTADQPAAVPAGATAVSMTGTFLNENQSGTGINLGSANLAPPAGFTVISASVSGVAPFVCPSSCTAAIVGNVVQLRGIAVPPGSAVTVAMSVTTPPMAPGTCTVASPCGWSVTAKQSNDFSGPPGNNLTTDVATSALNTVLAQLQFGAQPRNTTLGQVITDMDYSPGGPVTVKVADSAGTPVTSYHGGVSLALNTPNNSLTNPFPATLGGTTSTNASGGVATFADLTVSDPGNDFTLTASTSDLPPNTMSDSFDVQQAAALCAKNASCSTEAKSTNSNVTDGGVDVTVSSPSGDASELTQSIDFGSWPAGTRIGECGGASAHFAYQALSIPRPLTSTIITTDLELTKSNLNASINAQEICLAQADPFTAKVPAAKQPTLMPAQTVTLPDGTQGFAGLEPDCGTKSGQVRVGTGPCVTSRSGAVSSSGVGGTLTISDSSPSDRWIN